MSSDDPKSQQEIDVRKVLAADRWLIENGLVTESVQQNLLLYGHLSALNVKDVEVDLDVEKKEVQYYIYLTRRTLKKYNRFIKKWNKYCDPKTLWQKWRKLRLYKKNLYMNIPANLERLVGDFLPTFNVKVEVLLHGTQEQREQPSQEG